DGREMVDLGFNFCIASSARKTKGAPRIKLGAVPHYTYKANVLEVLDGDTIWVDVELGFNTWTTQKLRFRGINSAEVITAEGKIAKDYAIARLSACKFIAIKTYWRDKYTRYLADVFYDKDETDLTKLIASGKFLNQELLDEGYAVWYE
ncbi:MAG: thermonuclease family protein, partial [Candidatus Riflemargulisbacteria bacterium]